jgi:undecaprenyl-diphosphatase
VFRPLARLDAADRRLFDRLTRRDGRLVGRVLTPLSTGANQSALWLVIAAGMALGGGRRSRRAALRGVLSIAITSAVVNLPLKYLTRRRRPQRQHGDASRSIRVPKSSSFPSGHAASALAFATGAGLEQPLWLLPTLPLAMGVAYSRVGLGVHYPFDVVAGAAIGAGMGVATGRLMRAGDEWLGATTHVPESGWPEPGELILVVNPHAGHASHLGRARRAMADIGLQVVTEIPVQELDRLDGVLERNRSTPPVVVAVGGDGTVGQVADRIVGTSAVLGILPLGTSNDFARSLEIPIHAEKAVRLLSRGRVMRVDAGRFTGDGQRPRHFVHAAAVGINVHFARFATRADERERLGRLTYAIAAAVALRERPVFTCEIEYGDSKERLQLMHLAVINAPIFGGFLRLRVPGAGTDDGTLDAIMVEHLPPRRIMWSALYPAVGAHRRIRGIRTLQVSRLTVRPGASMDVTLDGDIAGRLPGVFEVIPRGLRVITPARRSGARR